ncbi:MAG TPA: hypothetical protein PLF29_03195 [bacterium]|nr:hypothetical protein [bacterium]
MKKLLSAFFITTGLLVVSFTAVGQITKQVTEADIKECIAKKEKEARAKGYPLTDPFATRMQCINELKGR